MKTKIIIIAFSFILFGLGKTKAQTVYGNVSAMAYDRSGKFIVTGGMNGTANIWDIAKKEITKVIKFYSSATVKAITISPDNKFMAIAVGGVGTSVYSFPEGKKIKQLKEAGSVNIIYLPDGNLATINYEGVIQVFDVATEKVVNELNPKKTVYNPLAVSADGKYLLAAAPKDNFKLFDLKGTDKSEIFKEKLASTPRSFAFSSDSKFFAVAGNSGDDAAAVYNTETKALVKSFKLNYSDNVILFSPDNKSLYITSGSGLDVINIETGATQRFSQNHKSAIKCLALSTDGKFLLTGSDDATVILSEVANGKKVNMFTHYDIYTKPLIHTLGQKWGGGLVVHSYRTPDGAEHGLIMAMEDLAEVAWSDNIENLIGTDRRDGSYNSEVIMKAGGSATEAAGVCRAYTAGGFNDWYLPSLEECEQISKNIGLTKWPDSYWTSTQAEKGTAYGFEFNKGLSDTRKISKKGRVRPVRAF